MNNNLILIQAEKILKGGSIKPGVKEAVRCMETYSSVVVVDVSDEQAADLNHEFSTIRTSVDNFLEELKQNDDTKDINVVVIGKTRYSTDALVVSSVDWENFESRHMRWLNALSGNMERAVAV